MTWDGRGRCRCCQLKFRAFIKRLTRLLCKPVVEASSLIRLVFLEKLFAKSFVLVLINLRILIFSF